MPTSEAAETPSSQKNEHVLEVEDLHKSFGPQVVLDGISFDLVRGETLGVLGRSGTGKSVLLKHIVGLNTPDQGSVRILGKDIASLTHNQLNEVRVKMGFLFQYAALYDSLTVEENVAFPLVHFRREMDAPAIKDRVEELLGEVGLQGHNRKMPADISGGMQKRVGLARALALDPIILLLDEPTAGLDPITSGEIDDLVLKLQQERKIASIVVTHDLESVRKISTRIMLLHKGNAVFNGSFEDLQKSDDDFVKQFLQRGSRRES